MADSLPVGFQLDQQAESTEAPNGAPLPPGFELNEDKYGSTGQQIKAGLEGAASALTFGASTAAEVKSGLAKPQDIQGRRETGWGHALGELGGIGVGMFYGAGEAAALESAGSAVAARVAGKSLVSKIGSQAAKLATENAMFQSGDEVSKYFSKDPHQSIGTAMADIGLSGLIGGGAGGILGVIPPIWKATVGKQVDSILNAAKNKSGGIDGMLSTPIKDALDKSGVQFAPEVKAALAEDPKLQMVAKTLEQSDTTRSGLEYQQTLKAAKGELANSAVGALGKDATHVEGLGELSKYEAGKSIGNTLADEISARVDPLAKEFEELKGKVGNVDLPPDTVQETSRIVADPQNLTGVPETVVDKTHSPGVMSQAADQIAELASKEGWLAAEGTPIESLVQFTQKNLGKQKTLKDLGNLISRIGEKAESLSSLTDRSATRAGGMIKNILKDVESGVIEAKLGEHGQELVDRFKNVRGAWKDASNLVDEVQEHIGVRASTSGYAKAVREMAQQDGEALLRRIAGSGNAAGLKMLQEKFPAAAQQFREFHLNSLLKEASAKAKPGDVINTNALIRGIDKMSPEMRGFVVPEAASQKIGAIGKLLEQMESVPHNFSNTARTLDKLNQYVPGGAVAMAAALSGHGAIGLLLGPLMKYMTKDAPDALRLSMLKFLGSNSAVDSAGFKAMADVARTVYRGEQAIGRAANGVLRSGSKINTKKNSQNDRDKLDKQLQAFQEEPEKLMSIAGDVGHYLPDHASAASMVAVTAVNYLNSLRPDTQKKMPFDAKMPADPVKEADFNRALDVAHNPLLVVEDIKEGEVSVKDLTTLQNVAPGFYSAMKQKLNNEIINYSAEDNEIPYKTRLGLAVFLGMPMDSTMNPLSIQAAQPKPMGPPPQQMAGAKPTASGMLKLGKLGPGQATVSQSREMSRAKHIS